MLMGTLGAQFLLLYQLDRKNKGHVDELHPHVLVLNFIIETISIHCQWYSYTKKRSGRNRRIFRMQRLEKRRAALGRAICLHPDTDDRKVLDNK